MLSIPDVDGASVIGSAARSDASRGSVTRASKASWAVGGVEGAFVGVEDVVFSGRAVDVDDAAGVVGTPPGGTFLPPPPCTVTLPPSGRGAWTGRRDLSTAPVDDGVATGL